MRTPDTGAIILPSSPPDIFAVSRPSYVTRDLQHSVHLLPVSTGAPFIILDSGCVEAGHYRPLCHAGNMTHHTRRVGSLLPMCHGGGDACCLSPGQWPPPATQLGLLLSRRDGQYFLSTPDLGVMSSQLKPTFGRYSLLNGHLIKFTVLRQKGIWGLKKLKEKR